MFYRNTTRPDEIIKCLKSVAFLHVLGCLVFDIGKPSKSCVLYFPAQLRIHSFSNDIFVTPSTLVFMLSIEKCASGTTLSTKTTIFARVFGPRGTPFWFPTIHKDTNRTESLLGYINSLGYFVSRVYFFVYCRNECSVPYGCMDIQLKKPMPSAHRCARNASITE